MHKLLLRYSLLISASACSPAAVQEQALPALASPQEMTVMQAVLQANGYLLSAHTSNSHPLFSRLLPLHILPSSSPRNQRLPNEAFAVRLDELLACTYGKQEQPLFTPQDSTALLTQPATSERLVDSTRLASADLLTPAQYRQQRQVNRRRQVFYRFSQPLFSADHTKAYLQVDAIGSGRLEYLVVKKGTHWEQVGSGLLWVE